MTTGGPSGRDMEKPWAGLTVEAVAEVPAQLGVFQVAERDNGVETVVHIGYAGGREPFGLRTALGRLVEANHGQIDRLFRFELTHAYLTRWEELLMVHQARHGELPAGNRDHPHPVGRLHLG